MHRSTQQQVLASDHDWGSLNKLKKINFVYKAYLNGGTQNKYVSIVTWNYARVTVEWILSVDETNYAWKLFGVQ